MDFDFPLLKQEIEAAVKQACNELLEMSLDDRIISFALYSDEGAMTVCPAFNTDAHLEAIGDGEDDVTLYYKYEPAEWKFEGHGAEEAFDAICTKLRSIVLPEDYSSNLSDESFAVFQEKLYETCMEVLEELVRSGFFVRTFGSDIIVLFTVSDYDYETEWYMQMIRRLNTDDAIQKEVAAYVKGWSD